MVRSPLGVGVAWRRWFRPVLDFALPCLCVRCHEPVADPQALCGDCWGRLSFISGPCCLCCGLPLDLAQEAGMTCGACLAAPPRFVHARAALLYDEGVRDLILSFKHADRWDLAPLFARWMVNHGAEALAGATLMVPVPLHWTRRLRRRGNQCSVLARAMAQISGIPWSPSVLQRTRATPSQGVMPSAAARRRNMRAAFRVLPRDRRLIRGENVVLIDDVMTTGATLSACAAALNASGAAKVSAVTIARVVRT